ncbi:MAG: ATP-binding protein [Sulfuricurvum sp.]|nr:ATP-binding protein [Sulfuricurvum sp.]MDP3023276.1 ATP-binding protein [Sulfuricurvum sp.]
MNLSFKYRFILSFLAIEITFISLIVFVNFNALSKLSDSLIEDKIETGTRLFSEMIKTPMVVYDLGTLDNHSTNFTHMRNIIAVKVFDTQQRLLSSSNSDPSLNIDFFTNAKDTLTLEGRTFRLQTAPIILEGEKIGDVKILFELTQSLKTIAENKKITFLIILLEIAISSIIAYWMGHRLTSALNQLTLCAQEISDEKSPNIPDLSDRNDELTILSNTLQLMQKRIDERNKNLTTALHESKVLNKELHAAKEAAEASTRAKSQFLASMSHEIRTPMNGVMGMLQLLEYSPLTDAQRNNVRIAQSSANSLLGLINDILDFSKIEAGKMDFEQITFDLHNELDAFIEIMTLKAKEKGLELVLDTTQLPQGMIISDPGRLRQILTNLVSNAIKFTAKGKIALAVALKKEDPTHGRLYIDVTDTGIGIAQEKIDSLFEMFTQADGSTTRQYGGTGLGLAIVKKLSNLMGGTVSATSTIKEGSTFSVNILVELATSSTVHKEQEVSKSPIIDQENPVWPSTTNILLVDDDPVNKMVAEELLKVVGLQTHTASNGAEALEILKAAQSKPYTLIFMDCQMPVMDGYQTTHVIRNGEAGEQYKNIPIIAMTANAMAGDREKCLLWGMNDYISKPIDINELQNALKEWVFAAKEPLL